MNAKTENHDVMDPAHVFDLAAESSKLSIRLSLLREVNNDMCHNWYWLANVRVVADHRVFRFRFVFWYDWNDAAEYFDVASSGTARSGSRPAACSAPTTR